MVESARPAGIVVTRAVGMVVMEDMTRRPTVKLVASPACRHPEYDLRTRIYSHLFRKPGQTPSYTTTCRTAPLLKNPNLFTLHLNRSHRCSLTGRNQPKANGFPCARNEPQSANDSHLRGRNNCTSSEPSANCSTTHNSEKIFLINIEHRQSNKNSCFGLQPV